MAKTLSMRSVAALQKRKARLLARMQIPADLVRASYVEQYLTCGKKNCRCHRGFKHGPFFYLVRCVDRGKMKKFLLRTPAQRRQARAGVGAFVKFQAQVAELCEINAELLKRGILEKRVESKPKKAL